MASDPKTAIPDDETDAAPDSPPAETQADEGVQAFREALEKTITISRDRLQEIIDDAVRRGRMTRADAEELVGRVLSRGREQAEDLLKQIEPLIDQIDERTAPARDRATEAAQRARAEVSSQVSTTAKRVRDSADQPLAHADRLRRRAGLPGFPITAYDQLSVKQINGRLAELSQEELRKVRDYEGANRNRIGVMRALEHKLES